VKVLGYVRVSTTEQADSGAGLEAQRLAIVSECERRGWGLAEMVEDGGFSGKSLKRPGISRALELLASREADALIVSKLDRLSRSLLDFAGIVADSQKQGWAMVCLDLGVDTATPQGRMMANVLASFAQFERELIGQRIREALAVKRSEGVRLGRKRETPDAVVAQIVAERQSGLSFQAIADSLNAASVPTVRGGRCWWSTSVRKVLLSVDYERSLV
jgi:DNA invertase Pin-like site-specific DNA recombinase